mmetsp:Transcript_37666/g.103478  ORF Transcript_37666/g.103478 Transcript_37666/m.103478 type:complete len:268 (-) Transcript_37666:237-1040(-)
MRTSSRKTPPWRIRMRATAAATSWTALAMLLLSAPPSAPSPLGGWGRKSATPPLPPLWHGSGSPAAAAAASPPPTCRGWNTWRACGLTAACGLQRLAMATAEGAPPRPLGLGDLAVTQLPPDVLPLGFPTPRMRLLLRDPGATAATAVIWPGLPLTSALAGPAIVREETVAVDPPSVALELGGFAVKFLGLARVGTALLALLCKRACKSGAHVVPSRWLKWRSPKLPPTVVVPSVVAARTRLFSEKTARPMDRIACGLMAPNNVAWA